MRLVGRCHCGNLEVTFETGRADELAVRSCTCSFCRRHGARCVSDAEGSVRIVAHDARRLILYAFGLRNAEFLVCGACGVYLGAVMTAGDAAFATINVNTFDAPHPFEGRAVPVSYEGESEEGRRARRAARWTPVAAFDAGSL